MKLRQRQKWMLGVVVVMAAVGALLVMARDGDAPPLVVDERALAESGIDVSLTEFAAEDLIGCGPVAGTAIYDYAAGSGHSSEREAVVRFVANSVRRAEDPLLAGTLGPGPNESEWVFVADDESRQVVYRLSEYDGRFVVGATSPC